jgi:hypothetical protein
MCVLKRQCHEIFDFMNSLPPGPISSILNFCKIHVDICNQGEPPVSPTLVVNGIMFKKEGFLHFD